VLLLFFSSFFFFWVGVVFLGCVVFFCFYFFFFSWGFLAFTYRARENGPPPSFFNKAPSPFRFSDTPFFLLHEQLFPFSCDVVMIYKEVLDLLFLLLY